MRSLETCATPVLERSILVRAYFPYRARAPRATPASTSSRALPAVSSLRFLAAIARIHCAKAARTSVEPESTWNRRRSGLPPRPARPTRRPGATRRPGRAQRAPAPTRGRQTQTHPGPFGSRCGLVRGGLATSTPGPHTIANGSGLRSVPCDSSPVPLPGECSRGRWRSPGGRRTSPKRQQCCGLPPGGSAHWQARLWDRSFGEPHRNSEALRVAACSLEHDTARNKCFRDQLGLITRNSPKGRQGLRRQLQRLVRPRL